MVTVKSDLTIVKLFWEGKTYKIKCEEVKYTDKADIEQTYACDDHEPNFISFGKHEYSIDLSGVQNYKKIFTWIYERQNEGYFKSYPAISTYRYDNNRKIVVDAAFSKCFIEEISGTNTEPFDVKLIAMHRAYRDSQNKLI